jgi:hypothetical protein
MPDGDSLTSLRLCVMPLCGPLGDSPFLFLFWTLIEGNKENRQACNGMPVTSRTVTHHFFVVLSRPSSYSEAFALSLVCYAFDCQHWWQEPSTSHKDSRIKFRL